MVRRFLLVLVLTLLSIPFSLYCEPPVVVPAETAVKPAADVAAYEDLLKALKETQKASEERIEQAVQTEKVREAWEMGKLIHEHILLYQDRAEYGKEVIAKLSKDLSLSQTEISFRVQFFQAYPNYSTSNNLSWSHYRELLSINDAKKRQELEKTASEKNLSVLNLRREIRKRKLGSEKKETILPEVKKGTMNTYQVVLQDEKLRIDLGFNTYIDLSEANKKLFKSGDILSMRGGKITNQGTLEDRYTYSAKVTSIIDGDTFHALVNLGFGITREEKLRLKSLDAPEIISAEGKEAKQVLEEVLLEDKGWITIKTSKDDQFGRYLSEIWVKDKNISQDLLDSGLFTLREDASAAS